MRVESVKRNYLYNIAYQILIMLLPLVTTPYISRILGAGGIGEYAYYFSIAKYFVLFAALGLNNYGNRTIAAIRNNREKLTVSFWGIYTMQLTFSIVVIVAYILFIVLTGQSKMGYILLLYVSSVALDINWFFFGLEQFRLTVTRNTIIKIASIICIFVFVKSSADVYIYGTIMSMSFLLSQLALWPFVRRYIDFRKPRFKEIIIHIKPNLLLFIPVIAVSLYKYMDKIMLGKMVNLIEVGYYENSEKLLDIPLALVTSLGTVMLPKMSFLLANEDEKEGERFIIISLVFAIFMSSSLGFGIMTVSKEFVPWFFGPGYSKCVSIIYVLAPSTGFMAAANVIRTQFLIPANRDKVYIASVSIGALSNIAINLIAIPLYGAVGAAIGTLVAEAAVCIYQFYKVRSSINYWPAFDASYPFIISSIIMFVSVSSWKIQIIGLLAVLAKVILGVIVFFVSLGVILYGKKRILHYEKVFPFDIEQIFRKKAK